MRASTITFFPSVSIYVSVLPDARVVNGGHKVCALSLLRRRYLNTVKGKGGDTYFPRALNGDGVEYKPWNYDFR